MFINAKSFRDNFFLWQPLPLCCHHKEKINFIMQQPVRRQFQRRQFLFPSFLFICDWDRAEERWVQGCVWLIISTWYIIWSATVFAGNLEIKSFYYTLVGSFLIGCFGRPQSSKAYVKFIIGKCASLFRVFNIIIFFLSAG